MSGKILVLGATGTVGREVVKALVEGGHRVRAVTRDVAGYGGPGEAVALDPGDGSTYGAALEGVERLFLLSPGGVVDPEGLLGGFVARALEEPTLARVVTMTAQGVEHGDNPYRRLEQRVEASGLEYVHVRPSWFMQNFHTYWGEGIRRGRVLAVPAGEAKVGFIDARDIGRSAAAALTRSDIALGRGYELTGPEALTHGEAAAVFTEVLGEEIRYQDPGEEAFGAQLRGVGMPVDYVEMLLGLFAMVRMGAAANVTGDVELLTGRAPLGVAQYARDYREALV